MKRYGTVVALRPGTIERYVELHAAVWPEVLKTIEECHIHNYSIFLRQLPDGRHYLFNYFEYTGQDYAADMAKMAADPATQRWWAICRPLMEPLPDRAPDEWSADMQEVFHVD